MDESFPMDGHVTLTPERNHTSDQEAKFLSPVLQSGFPKVKTKNKFLASTPAGSLPNDSPDHNKTELVLDILDRLCSPISSKGNGSTTEDRPTLNNLSLKSDGQKSVKRLFNNCSENESIYSQSKRLKYTVKKNYSIDSDSFKEHDISDSTLLAICEATNHLMETEALDEEGPELDIKGSKECIASAIEIVGQQPLYSNLPSTTVKEPITVYEQNNTLKPGEFINSSPNHLIYLQNNDDDDKMHSRLTVRKLLSNALIMEKANKLTTRTCKVSSVKSQIIEPKSSKDFNKHDILDTLPGLKSCSNISSNEESFINHSTSITDSQFCEALDVAEIMNDLDQQNNVHSVHDHSITTPLATVNIEAKINCNLKEKGTSNDNTANQLHCEIHKQLLMLDQFHLQDSKNKLDFYPAHNQTSSSFLQSTNKKTKVLDYIPTQPEMKCDDPVNEITSPAEDETKNTYQVSLDDVKNNPKITNGSLLIPSNSYEDQSVSQKFHLLNLNNVDNNVFKTPNNNLDCDLFSSFQTVSGKTVKMSEEALNKVRKTIDEQPIKEIASFPSFQTASGKTVSISEDSLSKARQNFDEQPPQEGSTFPSFQTASGKTIQISEGALNKARQIFDEQPLQEGSSLPSCQTDSGNTVKISEDSLSKAREILNQHSLRESASLSLPSFQTASGKTVKISEDSLSKVRQIFNEQSLQEGPSFPSFQTASGKTVKISEHSLSKAREIFAEQSLQEGSSLPSFQTAKGKTVKISEDALNKSRQTFDEQSLQEGPSFPCFQTASGKTVKISEDSLSKAREILVQQPLRESVSRSLPSFQTASGKTVKISQDALNKARQIFDEQPLQEGFSLPSFQTASGETVKISEDSLSKVREIFNEQHLQESPSFPCFQTASGKTVKISEHSLSKAREIFAEQTLQKGSSLPIFQTASGKNVKISEDSLSKSREILDQCPLQESASPLLPSFQTVNGKTDKICDDSLSKVRQTFNEQPLGECASLSGFQTASGKTVKISEDSLNKARQTFEEQPLQEGSSFPGFQTASGKTVKICEVSLNKARKIFDEHPVQEGSSFPCFQTASGKTVKISEDSLSKAREILVQQPLRESASPTLPSFQTASGISEQTVKISKDAINKNWQIFDEQPLQEGSSFPSIQTASGKTVKICEVSLNKARKVFDEHPVQEGSSFPCFQTASGKTVKITEDSLNKARQIFDEQSFNESALSSHFQTASGRTVMLAEDSLIKARQIFDDQPSQETAIFAGTAEGNVQENRINKARHMFDHQALKESDLLPSSHTSSLKTISDTEFQLAKRPKTILERPEDLLGNCTTFTDGNPPRPLISNIIANSSVNPKLSSPIACVSSHLKINIDNVMKQACMPQTSIEKMDDEMSKKFNDLPSSCIVNTGNRPIKKPRKLFDDSSSELKIKYFETIINENSSVYPSVISEDDLSLLNKSLMNVTGELDSSEQDISNIKNNSELNYLSPGVAREVAESMAALIADEESNSPLCRSWIFKPVLSSPTTIERNVRLPSIDCDEKEINLNNTPLSPVLGSLPSIKAKKFFRKNISASLNSNLSVELPQHSTPLSMNSNFKPPYATSTPNEVSAKGKLKRSLQESLEKETKKRKFDVEKTLSVIIKKKHNIEELRIRAAEQQDKCIKDKLGHKKSIQSCKGSFLMRTQTEKRRSLQCLADEAPLKHYSLEQLLALGVKRSVIETTVSNALNFKFSNNFFSEEAALRNVEGMPVGDGALLVLDREGEAGVTEVTRAFLASPSVDPALASVDWVHNHFRWLIVKMAATERMFPLQLANRHLTPNNLLLQLKYRYDREIDRCQRPVLRKILEKDESATRPIVLFVADIFTVETGEGVEKRHSSSVELELCDGWYSVRTSVDYEMNQLIHKRIVRRGTKLIVVGAELVNNEDGCNPLETPATVRLKISTNSCRRVRWFTRLGLQPRSLPPLSLGSVLARGGSIPSLSAVVARRYPLLFMEKLSQGKSVVRGEKAEQAAADAHQHLRQQTAEKLLSRLHTEQERSKRRTRTSVTRRQLQQVTSTQELCRLLDDIDDITLFQDAVSIEQMELVQQYRQEEAAQVQQQLQDKLVKELDEKIPPRLVTRMLKIRLADYNSDGSAILTLWNPSEQVLDLLVEDHHLIFHQLTASGYSRFGDLQLTGGRHTKFVLEKNSVSLWPRSVTLLPELRCSDFKSQFSEIDVVGLVLPQDPSSDNPKLFYLADADYNFLAVSLSIDLKESGFSSVVSAGKLVAVSNLTWHTRLVSWSLPIAHATEVTLISQHPRLSHLQQALGDLAQKIKSLDLETYKNDCVERIKSLKAHRDSAGITPLKQRQESKILSLNEQPSSSTKMATLSNSSHGQTSDAVQESDTPSNRKLAWLEQFGEPPSLSPLNLNTPSRVKRNFHPPKKRPLENK